MHTGKARIAIGLPVFNGERHLPESLDSILGQSFADFDLVISDNCSSDATRDICQAAARRDRRIRYVRQDRNIGVNRNHAAVLHLADPNAEFFRWAAADDPIEPAFLMELVRIMDGDPGLVAVVPDVVNIDDQGQVLRNADRTLDLRGMKRAERAAAVLDRSYQMVFAQGLIRMQTLRSTSLRLTHFGWDFSMLLELALRGPIAQPAAPKLRRRYHAGAASRAKTLGEIRRWVDPTSTSRWYCPHWRWSYEKLRAAAKAPIPIDEKLECIGLVARNVLRGRRALLNDLVMALRLWLRLSDQVPF